MSEEIKKLALDADYGGAVGGECPECRPIRKELGVGGGVTTCPICDLCFKYHHPLDSHGEKIEYNKLLSTARMMHFDLLALGGVPYQEMVDLFGEGRQCPKCQSKIKQYDKRDAFCGACKSWYHIQTDKLAEWSASEYSALPVMD